MNVNVEPLRGVIARFPQSGARIRNLFDGDEAFRELCSDYTECLAVLERLRREQGGGDPRIEEYGELRVNLERELSDCISESTAG